MCLYRLLLFQVLVISSIRTVTCTCLKLLGMRHRVGTELRGKGPLKRETQKPEMMLKGGFHPQSIQFPTMHTARSCSGPMLEQMGIVS